MKQIIATKKKTQKDSANIIAKEVIYKELFIARTSNQKYDREKFIANSGATSHLMSSEENMMKPNNAEIKVTIRDSRILTSTNHRDWHSYQKREREIHHVMLYDMAIIPFLYVNICSMM